MIQDSAIVALGSIVSVASWLDKLEQPLEVVVLVMTAVILFARIVSGVYRWFKNK